MTVIDLRDIRVPVTLAEEEARFVAGLVEAAVPHLTEQQLELAHRVCCKFLLAGQATVDELVERHGKEAVLDAAARTIAAYPGVDEVRLG